MSGSTRKVTAVLLTAIEAHFIVLVPVRVGREKQE